MDSGASSHFDDERVNRRKILLAVITAAALFLIGVLVGRSLAPEEGDSSAEPPADRRTSQATAENTEEGAVTAATRFARIMTGPSGDEQAYRDAMTEIAAPQWRERARQLAENAVDFVQDRYGDGGGITFYPVRYRVNDFSVDEASIDIWGLVLASGPKLAGIEESWITGTLDLVWLDDRWKVIGQSSRGGPTPEPLQTDGDAALPNQLEDFEEYEDVQGP